MADYPDWTDSVAIIAAEIMLPIDVQAAYIMMPIDIQAQYVDLDINIKSQTVTVNIDIDAQSVGVYLQADWQVLQGTDKNEYGYATVGAGAEVLVLDYTVTAGKTFYICQWGYGILYAGGVIAKLYFVHNASATCLVVAGGYSGGNQSFTKPIAIVAGDKIRVFIINMDASGAHTGYGSFGGYEI